MTRPFVLGVDSSTQSVKVELRDIETGRLEGRWSRPHPPTSPPVSEQDPELWWDALREALNDVGDRRADVAAIAVAGQQHGLVLLDDDGRALRPAKLWNDTTNAAEADALVGLLGAPQWAAACGSVPVPAFTITKLAWVIAHAPGLLERAAHIGLPHDYLTWKLSGRWATDRGDASGTGWWSPTTNRYAPDLLDIVLARSEVTTDELLTCLPEVLGPLEPAGHLTAGTLGLADDTVVAAGTGDNMAAALGLGLVTGDVVVSVGTSGTVYAVSDRPTADAEGAVAGFADATGRFLPLVCTLNATKVTDAVARLVGADHEAFDRLVLSAPAGSSSVVTVPWFDGERTPNRPDARGVTVGLTPDVTPAEVARAAVEGVACALLEGVAHLERVGVDVSGRFFLIGGGSRSAAYRAVFGQLAGRDLIVPDADETVATGACLQAAACIAADGPDALRAIAQRWGLGAGTTHTVPERRSADASATEIRDRYRNVAASV